MVLYVPPVGDEWLIGQMGHICACPAGIGHLIHELEGSDHSLGIICLPGMRRRPESVGFGPESVGAREHWHQSREIGVMLLRAPQCYCDMITPFRRMMPTGIVVGLHDACIDAELCCIVPFLCKMHSGVLHCMVYYARGIVESHIT